jgi:putative flippase GtrA
MLMNERNLEIIRYIIIGILTTLVSYISFWLFYYILHFETNLSNLFSVILAIIFAFITNKIYVFRSIHKSIKDFFMEATVFFFSRGVSIVLEIIGVLVLTSFYRVNPMVSKISVSFFVVIINYFTSKYLVFKPKEKGNVNESWE